MFALSSITSLCVVYRRQKFKAVSPCVLVKSRLRLFVLSILVSSYGITGRVIYSSAGLTTTAIAKFSDPMSCGLS